MNKKLYLIQQKINYLQAGLLRFHDKDELVTLEVKTTANDDASLNCIIMDSSLSGYTMADKTVNLIQKIKDDYLYITGRVQGETGERKKILFIKILKASWFVRKRKAGISWLKEKYVYETLNEEYIIK